MDLSPKVLLGVYQDILAQYESSNKDVNLLTKTLNEGSLQAEVRVDVEKKMLSVQVFLLEKVGELNYSSLVYTGEFKFHEQLHALIATACDFKPIEKERPKVTTQCEKETKVANEIIKFVLSNVSGNVNDQNNVEFLECIKTKLKDIITTFTQQCFVVVIEQGSNKYEELKQ